MSASANKQKESAAVWPWRLARFLARVTSHPASALAFKSDDKIISDFAAFMAKGQTKSGVFYDISVLPHPKEAILPAIEREILREPSDARVDWLRVGAEFLADFQEGVGPAPLPWIGIDLAELARTTPDVMEQAKIIAHSHDAERAQRMLAVTQIERNQISRRIDAAVRMRNARFRQSTLHSLSRTAYQGDAEAQFKIGSMHVGGRDVPEDLAEAAKWYRRAADQGHATAQCQLALMYAIGSGVPQDYAEAVQWCRKAADKGIVTAQSQLGFMFANGQGVAQDFAEAVRWSRKAADQGDAKAQFLLGAMYHNGQGVPQDLVQAHMWLSLAGSKSQVSKTENSNTAVSTRDLVAAKMTPAQIAAAQKLAREWKST